MPQNYTNKEKIIYWTISLTILFGFPYLLIVIRELTKTFPAFETFLSGLIWLIIWAVIVLGIYETYKWIKFERWRKKEQKQVYEEALILDEIMKKDKKEKEQQDQQQQ